MKLNRKGFELVCCNCGSTEIQTWFDEEKKQIVIMCEECENSSREDSEALRQLKELAKRTELELTKKELVEILLLTRETLKHEEEDLNELFKNKTFKHKQFSEANQDWLEFFDEKMEYSRWTLTNTDELSEEVF